jgi:DnaJ-class molecular chaperone
MVWKETCSNCKGDKYVRITRPDGSDRHRKCPACKGEGYKVRIGQRYPVR